MEAQRRSGGVALHVRNLVARSGGVVNATLRPLDPGEKKSLGIHCTRGWVVPGPVWTGVEKRKPLVPTVVQAPGRPARSQLLFSLR